MGETEVDRELLLSIRHSEDAAAFGETTAAGLHAAMAQAAAQRAIARAIVEATAVLSMAIRGAVLGLSHDITAAATHVGDTIASVEYLKLTDELRARVDARREDDADDGHGEAP